MTGNSDLFGAGAAWETLPMEDADVRLLANFYRAPETAHLLQTLLRDIDWRQENIVLWGREVAQPRLTAWYGDPGSRYAYSGRLFHPLPWSATLLRLKKEVEQATGHAFNSVLLNLYRDENDSVGWHSDSEPELGTQPIIASLSLGETRRLRFRRKRKGLDGRAPSLTLPLADGSLLLMAGATQACWQHAIVKESSARGPRINLTFRTIEPAGRDG